MSKSIKLTSPSDTLKYVFITYDSGWKNAQLYVRGKVVKSVESLEELQEGIEIKVDELGTIEASIDSTTLELSLSVDGEKYVREFTPASDKENTKSIRIVFGIQVVMNLVLLLICIQKHIESPSTNNFNVIVLYLSAFFLISYATCIVFLMRGFYFFYFLGTALLTFSTIGVIYTTSSESLLIMAVFTAPRIALLLILFFQFKNMLKRLKAEDTEPAFEIIDEDI